MHTIAKITRYSYARKTCPDDRQLIIQLYEQGYAIRRIAFAVEIRTHSVRHHLMAAGILEKDRKVKLWNAPTPVYKINVTKNPNNPHYNDAQINKIIDKNWPKHIQEVYIRMHKEDEEMRERNRINKKLRQGKHSKELMAQKPKVSKFKAAYTFIL